jgi:type II secretory pathway component PulF
VFAAAEQRGDRAEDLAEAASQARADLHGASLIVLRHVGPPLIVVFAVIVVAIFLGLWAPLVFESAAVVRGGQ